MMRSVPARLRAPVTMLAGGAVICAVSVAAWGWETLVSLVPVTLVAVAGYYVIAGKDSDFAAMIRAQADERQAYRRLKIQALVGRVVTLAAAVGYLAAVWAKVTLWPFTIFLLVPGLTFLAGWLVYRDRADGREQTGP
jgi:hypothetical protein